MASHPGKHASSLIKAIINNDSIGSSRYSVRKCSSDGRRTNLSKSSSLSSSSSIGDDVHWCVNFCLPARLSSTELCSFIRMQLVESSGLCDALKIKVESRGQHNGLTIDAAQSFPLALSLSLVGEANLTRYRLRYYWWLAFVSSFKWIASGNEEKERGERSEERTTRKTRKSKRGKMNAHIARQW